MTSDTYITLTTHLRERLAALYGKRLRKCVVFGSYARSQATPDSDLDVLVVLADPVDRYLEYRRLGDVTVDMMEEFGVYVAPVIAGEQTYLQGDSPLLHSVREEGLLL